MRKRLLIGLLTVAMTVQALPLSVVAAPTDSINEEVSIETLTEEQPGIGTDSQTDQSEGEQSGEIPSEDPGELPGGESGEDQSDNVIEEPEGNPSDEESEGDPSDEESEDGSSDEQSESYDEAEDQFDETLEEDAEEPTEDMPVESEFLFDDVSDGVYQAGAFSVFNESVDTRIAPNSITPNATVGTVAEAEEYVYEQLKARAVVIDISAYNIPVDNCRAFYSGVLNEHPDLYYVTTGYSYSYYGNIVISFRPIYLDGLDDAAFQSGLQEALSVVKPGMTELEKAVVLHDYLVINCEYDYDNYLQGTIPKTSYSAYGVLADGIAVCQGYALAYKLLLNRVGIKCYMVTSDSMNHAWNLIVLDGKYYQVDVTWDDPTWDLVGRAVHTYMFRSDAAFAKHSDWEITSGSKVVNYTATDTRYDHAFWTGCRSPLVLTENGCYYTSYANRSANIVRQESLEDITGTGTIIQNIGTWPVWDQAGYTWSNAYSGLFLMNGRLYYNDKSFIYSIALDGTGRRTEFTADTTDGYIYGSALSRGKILYCLHQTPSLTGKETVLTADIAVCQNYAITYFLCGGTNNSANPSIYTSETDTVILQDAVRNGYRFDGWYRDASYRTKVTQIPKGSRGDVTLYAKWVSTTVSSEMPTVDITPSDGNVVMEFSGTYYTESADKILKRLNEIRLEACEEGVIDPYTNQPLTLDDYVPLQWSSDLEAIARLRAAEATVSQGHTRPNGMSCFTVTTDNNEQSWAENLAWNYSGLMAGIEQWYGEKKDWVNQASGKVTGHYENIISTNHHSVAVGTFRLTSGGWYATAQEFSYKESMDEQQNPSQGQCTQPMEVQGKNVSSVAFTGNQALAVKEGDTVQLPVNVTVKYADSSGTVKSYIGPYQAGGNWSSSDDTVLTVNSTGLITAKAKGIAKVTVSAGKVSASQEIMVCDTNDDPLIIQLPEKTTYKVGQAINLKGGKVTYLSGKAMKTADIKANMISGFDSTRPGICKVNVTYGGYTSSFDTLIVEEPKLTALCGQSLEDVAFPPNDYGTYSWQDGSPTLDKVSVQTYAAVFTPNDKNAFQELTDLKIQVTIQTELDDSADVSFKNSSFTYNGTEQEPKVVVSVLGNVLTEGQDYTLSYENNIAAGEATVTVLGTNGYFGGVSRTFTIDPAQLTITARNKEIIIGDPVPGGDEYEYEISGLMSGDSLTVQPVLSCDGVNSKGTDAAGRYDIVPFGADAGENYEITYVNGTLTVASEYASCVVTFDVQGHGTLADYLVKVGSTITKPNPDPTAEGYRFDGWYKDSTCTKVWNFDTDIVQSDLTLYAKWLRESENGGFAIQEISDVYYTGKAYKPAVSVYDVDSGALLKSGKDYQIKYYNNTNANKNGMLKEGNGTGEGFNADLPYVEITGKGNYKDVVKVNFNILQASIGDGSNNPASGVTLKISDQLVTSKKAQKPFSSIKYVKSMKLGTDYTLSLEAVNARDQSGRSISAEDFALENQSVNVAIPAGYEGEFLLTVQGMGNYEGSVCKRVWVTDKAHLIKNATITLGKNLKNKEYTDEPIVLTPSEVNSADTFTVKYGKVFLRYNKDYTVRYLNNDRVGKATLVITGMGEYAGSKSVTFNIKGKAFTAKKVKIEGIENKVYSGSAWTQNGVVLAYIEGKEELKDLQYGTDYTISYSKNVNKGTATMTFKGVDKAGYSGSFKKTFKITAQNLSEVKLTDDMLTGAIAVSYTKAGAKPVDQIVLENSEGLPMSNGKDYTLKYANNKALAGATDEKKPPTIIIKGKGNYTGELKVYYNITKANLNREIEEANITIKKSSVGYLKNKAAGYAYKPSIKIMDGKTALRAGTDYNIEYVQNTQADYDTFMQKLKDDADYMQKLKDGIVSYDGVPRAVVTEKEDSSYGLSSPIIIPLPIYQTKMTKSNLTVEIGEAVYTGSQVKPEVTVYYKGEDGLIPLEEGEDYSISYGANTASGKNKGSVTISGIAPYYGGDLTVKFEIVRKPILFNIDDLF